MLQEYQMVRLPKKLISEIKTETQVNMRSVPKHIEYLITLARAARDNPDLAIEFIENCLEAKREMDAGIPGVPWEKRFE